MAQEMPEINNQPVAEATPGADQQNPSEEAESGITADEIALYDRQIRLWGVQAQEKIRNADILLISIKALANEIAKNLVLAGIKSITIIDHSTVEPTDLGAQFFVSESDIGANRAEAAAPHIRKLNPRVKVIVDAENIAAKKPSYFSQFDVVIATDLDPDSLNLINTATRVNNKPFYAAGVHGFYGFIFSDLIQHDYVVEREKGNRDTVIGPESRTRSVVASQVKKEGGKLIEHVTKREVYSTWLLASQAAQLPEDYLKSKRRLRSVPPLLSCFRALWEFQQAHGGRCPRTDNADELRTFTTLATDKHRALGLQPETLKAEILRSFLQNLGCEIAPVSAVLGGQLAQDVINVLGQKNGPIQNFVFFDGESYESRVFALHPEGPLGVGLLPLSQAVIENSLPSNGGPVAA